ncbi:MAG: class I SAM-dependent RNA methyltransferase [Puniceicoccaceae bacterium]
MTTGSPEAPRHFVPEPFAYHEEKILRIDDLTNLGVGLGRIDGWVVMVPFALPGETVRARIFRNRSNFSEADLVEVLEASPDRVAPECPLFGACGGCQYQHLRYEAQLQWMRNQVREAFVRIGGIEADVPLPVPSPKRYGYRSKITPHYRQWREGGDFPIGFLRAGQRTRLIDVPRCPIATPAVNAALPALRDRIRGQAPKGKKKKNGATLLLRETMEGVVTDPRAMVTERVGERVFQFRAGEFFQNNPSVLPAFAGYVAGQAAAGADFLIDVYCGAGLFSLFAADRFERVVGIEVSAAAVTLAESNAALNGIANAEFRAGEAGAVFARILDFPADRTAVVLDPPRRGCDEGFLRQLSEFGPARIVYVSCDPATQARDLRILGDAAYRIEAVQPFDLFPQTRHIENVATLSKAPTPAPAPPPD